MTMLILLVAIALIAATKLLKGKKETQGMVVSGLGVLLLVLIVLRFTTCSNAPVRPVQLTVDRNWAVGWKLGEAIAGSNPEGGTVVVLQGEPSSDQTRATAESQLDGLKYSLPEDQYQLVVHRPSALGALYPESRDQAEEGGGVSLKESLTSNKDAVAIVSFAYLPVTPRMKDKIPPVYLLDGFASGFWVPSMKAGLVKAAVTTHRDSSKINFNMEKGTPQQRFDAIWQVFTPENVDTFTQ